jgi:hypothetical protein
MTVDTTKRRTNSRAAGRAKEGASAGVVRVTRKDRGATESARKNTSRDTSPRTAAVRSVAGITPCSTSTTSTWTPNVRGLTCGRCNRGLGLLGDSIDGVRKALDYLHRYEVRKKITQQLATEESQKTR